MLVPDHPFVRHHTHDQMTTLLFGAPEQIQMPYMKKVKHPCHIPHMILFLPALPGLLPVSRLRHRPHIRQIDIVNAEIGDAHSR